MNMGEGGRVFNYIFIAKIKKIGLENAYPVLWPMF